MFIENLTKTAMQFIKNCYFKIKRNKATRYVSVVIQPNCIISADTTIGENTYISFNSSVTRSTIGRYCSIGSNVSIGNGEHNINDISTNCAFLESAYQKLTEKDVIIGNDVWIGVGSIIRRGVTIGNGAVIGANSFVNKDVPPYAVAVGSPARVIKYRFKKEMIEKIEESCWWQYEKKEALKRITELRKLL